MSLLIWSSVFGVLIALSLIRAVRQSQHYENLPEDFERGSADLPSITVIIPMRNEERNIDACLRGLLVQHYPSDRLRIIVVDDNSTDRSAAIVFTHAAANRRVHLLSAEPLPEAWAGKPHACWRGALASNADWLCFLDADTVAEPALLQAAIAVAREKTLDMLSLAPFQELTFFFDRLLVPLGFLTIAATQDLARVNSATSPDATANGQCLLFRARSYFGIGGHAAVSREICEDAALARRIKAAHLRFALMGAERLIRARMYRTPAELWQGLSKNITEVYGGRAATLAIALAVLFVGGSALLLPPLTMVAAFREPTPVIIAAALLAVAGVGAFLATTIALAHRWGMAWWYGLLSPLACALGAAIAVNGVILRTRGRVPWKGRIYTGCSTV